MTILGKRAIAMPGTVRASVRTIHVRMTPTTRPTWPSGPGAAAYVRGPGAEAIWSNSRPGRAWREGAFAGPALPGLLDQRIRLPERLNLQLS